MSGAASPRVCPLAERATATDLIEGLAPAPWVVRRCRETGFVFLENPPGYDSLKSELAWEVTWQREADARAAAEPTLYALSTKVKSFRKKVVKRHKVANLATALVRRCASDPIRLLDLGCGSGQLLGLVMDRLPRDVRARCHPYGIELSNELARRSSDALAPYGGRCVHASALDGLATFDAAFFDLIVMSSFLEHEIQPLPLLREAARALCDGGHVLIKVPNYASWNRVMRGPRWCGYRWPDHVNYFTPDTLSAMAQRADLAVARMNWFDRFPLSDSLYAVLRTT
ncbi:MAG: class I SAM-dependent methyltransferase [Aquincola sp.]|nr:class I SAM-dependent methyltransferase [Aquincola sp.]MDH5331733.1 class I SAM-dependent methyltransferase [Aquincola sp.]